MKRTRHGSLDCVVLALVASVLAPGASAVTCSASTTSVNFGAYDVFSVADDLSTGTVVIACQKQASDPSSVTVAYTVAASTGSSNSYVTRTMTSGATSLNYNTYTNSNRTTVWGNGSSPTQLFSGSFSLTNSTPSRNRTHTTYGRIAARQDVAAGTYTDNLLVTVTW